MGTSVGSTEAARILGVSKATLYAYVSRGIVGRRTAVDGRTSLYDRDELDALARRSRTRPSGPRPSIDVQIATAVSRLDDDGVWYRGHRVDGLAREHGFEAVAELLWTGELPDGPPDWPIADAQDAERCRRVRAVAPVALDPIGRLALAATVVGAGHPTDDPPTAARRLLSVAHLVLDPADTADPADAASLAGRLARAWTDHVDPTLDAAIERAMVLLADHELATSTMAVRLAGSVRADPATAFTAGFSVLRGPLHGSAAGAVHRLLAQCHADGTATAVERAISERRRLPGFGHAVYRNDDPRFAPLLDAVQPLGALTVDAAERLAVVELLLVEVGHRLTVRPNVDLALGALSFTAGLDPDVPVFAVARLAGWAAHLAEELDERPLRFRGIARTDARTSRDELREPARLANHVRLR